MRPRTEHGSFDAKTREAIALAVAAENGCVCCHSAHTAGGQAAGESLEETVAIWNGTTQPGPRIASLLTVAREITGNAGWSNTELAALLARVAVNMFTSYFSHCADRAGSASRTRPGRLVTAADQRRGAGSGPTGSLSAS